MEGIKVSTLYELCKELIKNGHGNKTIMISSDDEGNEYHTLYYGFDADPETIKQLNEFGMFHDRVNLKDIVILG